MSNYLCNNGALHPFVYAGSPQPYLVRGPVVYPIVIVQRPLYGTLATVQTVAPAMNYQGFQGSPIPKAIAQNGNNLPPAQEIITPKQQQPEIIPTTTQQSSEQTWDGEWTEAEKDGYAIMGYEVW